MISRNLQPNVDILHIHTQLTCLTVCFQQSWTLFFSHLLLIALAHVYNNIIIRLSFFLFSDGSKFGLIFGKKSQVYQNPHFHLGGKWRFEKFVVWIWLLIFGTDPKFGLRIFITFLRNRGFKFKMSCISDSNTMLVLSHHNYIKNLLRLLKKFGNILFLSLFQFNEKMMNSRQNL